MNQNCRICLGQHEDEVHAATARVHEWFRMQVNRSFQSYADAALDVAGAAGTRQLDAA